MKQVVFFICLMIMSFIANGQELEKNYQHDLKGPVKELRNFSFRNDDEYFGKYVQDTTERYISEIREFDTAGRLVQIYSPIDTTDFCGCKVNRKTLTYSPTGFIQTITFFKEDWVIERHFTFDRDANGKILLQKDFYRSPEAEYPDVYSYKYDGNRLVEIKESNKESAYPTIIEYVYNPKGQVIKEVYENHVVYINEFTYDEKGRLSAKYDVRYDLGKILIAAYTYNEEGLIKEQSGKRKLPGSLRGAKYVDYKSTNSYQYDQHGNWINLVSTRPDGTRVIQKREIDYY